jgi:hypothetical protein
MYINLLLGVLFVVAVIMLIRAWWQERRPARELLEEELRRRREREKAPEAAARRLRELGVERLKPVLRAVEDMRNALPENTRFTCMLDEDGLRIELPAAEGRTVTLLVRHRVQAFSLDRGTRGLEEALLEHERFVLSHPEHAGRGESVARDQDECIRMVARELAHELAHEPAHDPAGEPGQ